MRRLVPVLLLLAGCATQQGSAPPISSLNSCGELRHERARIQSIAETALVTLNPIQAQNVRAKARYRMAAVDQKAADMGCRQGFGG